jgi:hypothetical protein
MLHPLVQKYRRKGILVDANLLVVLLVGKLGPAHLKNCRATKSKSFTPDDYSLLVQGAVVSIVSIPPAGRLEGASDKPEFEAVRPKTAPVASNCEPATGGSVTWKHRHRHEEVVRFLIQHGANVGFWSSC